MTGSAALLSVSDRTGIESLASALHNNGYALYGTSGTAAHLRAAGLPCEDVGALTGFPPLCDGRVKTLHPKIFAGILADRTRAQHLADLAQYEIPSFAVVAVNLYPFEQTTQRRDASEAEIVEQIDIGGVTLLRAAAKNYAHVAALSDPRQYAGFIEALARGGSSLEDRRTWATAAFERCERYDAVIAAHFEGAASEIDLPDTLRMTLTRAAELRYGENPQTRAAFYFGPAEMPLPKQLWGKTLSYNNLLDLDSCLRLLAPIEAPLGFPAGVLRHAFSAFGGIVACGAEVDEATADVLASRFLEVVAAPSFSPAALERLKKKKNLRLLQFDASLPAALLEAGKVRSALGGILIEHPDPSAPPDSWTVMTEIAPTREHWRDLLFAFGAVRQVKSNAAVVVSDEVTLGVCGGQTNRVAAVELACERAGDGVRGAVLATDGFFPFADGLDAAIRAGISAVIAPSGSVRDAEVIEAARNGDIALVFAARRYFLH
jgi:phosphoribosylaminoimidazolecarboxamide formyltransferase/IMP cyclohydrolase